MVFMVPLLIMATSLVSKINTRVALVKGWVNSFLAFMGQLYIGFYKCRILMLGQHRDECLGQLISEVEIILSCADLCDLLALLLVQLDSLTHIKPGGSCWRQAAFDGRFGSSIDG